MEEKARRRKICSNPKCQEHWQNMNKESEKSALDFIFCPFCAEELQTNCSVCEEPIGDSDYKFCPWCGKEFE